MKTKRLKVLAVDTAQFNNNYPGIIPVTKDTMDSIVEKIRLFMINKVEPFLNEYKCEGEVLYFIDTSPGDYVTGRVTVNEGIPSNFVYVNIYVPLLIGSTEVPLKEFCRKIHDMMAEFNKNKEEIVEVE